MRRRFASQLLEALQHSQSGAGELADLIIEISAALQLPWRDDEGHEPNGGLSVTRRVSSAADVE